VLDPVLKARIIKEGLEPYLADNQNAWALAADGEYHRVAVKGRARPFSAQQSLLDRMAEQIESEL